MHHQCGCQASFGCSALAGRSHTKQAFELGPCTKAFLVRDLQAGEDLDPYDSQAFVEHQKAPGLTVFGAAGPGKLD